MAKVHDIKKLTDNRFLNLYELDASFRDGSRAPYYMSSRRRNIQDLKAVTGDQQADGVIIFALHRAQNDRVVLIRQFRYPINDYVYELPAGLVDRGEDPLTAGIREMQEETGLELEPVGTARPFFTTVGMTDESCATVFGYCTGHSSNELQENTEDIQVVLADRAECLRILREERVALPCGYWLMHFVSCKEDPLEILKETYHDHI